MHFPEVCAWTSRDVAWFCQGERMRNSEKRTSARRAAAVIGAAVALLVVTTVLLAPYVGVSACFGWGADACQVSWTSPAGVPTSYALWGGAQLGIIAGAVLLQLLLLRTGATRSRAR